MNFEFKLIDRILSLEFKTATAKEIAVKLGMHSSYEIGEISKTLNQMVSDGSLTLSGTKYSKAQATVVYRGVLRGNRRGFAFLIREDGGEDLFIPNKSLNGAMHGDTVLVKIVSGDEGRVTSVLERGIKTLVGEFTSNGGFGFVVPDNSSYYKDIYVSAKNKNGAQSKTKVVVEIIGYGDNPEGVITEVIGNSDEKESEVLSILKAHGFFNYFPEAVEKEAKSKQYQSVHDRTSYIGMPTVTIDGDDSKDLDDAISVLKVGDCYKLYVHIADVSQYVEYGSLTDEEAFKRCTSVYFPGSVYPMLPKILSNGICSLNQGEDRLALTCVMTIDKQGNVVDADLVKSLINNTYRLTYNQVDKMLKGDRELREQFNDIMPMMGDMYDLYRVLNAQKQERGSINFETKECKIYLDDKGDVDKIEPYPYLESNGIIEEFMLKANETVARLMCEKAMPFVYRAHEKPDEEKMKNFKEFASSLGYYLPKQEEVTPKDLQQLLDKIHGQPLEAVISKVMLRSMKKAKYTDECLGHFGLALKYYCHFTSPIRRYPDLQIHRIIKDMIDNKLESIPKLAKWCKEVASVSSEREKEAELSEREIDDFYKTEYMLRHVGEEFDGIISGVTGFGVFVELDNTCEGLARVINLPKDEYEFVEDRYTMRGAYHTYTLGQQVRIKVLECDSLERRVSFCVLENEIEKEKREKNSPSTDNSLGGGTLKNDGSKGNKTAQKSTYKGNKSNNGAPKSNNYQASKGKSFSGNGTHSAKPYSNGGQNKSKGTSSPNSGGRKPGGNSKKK